MRLRVTLPVILYEEVTGFEKARVAGCGGVMIKGGHPLSKGVICHNDKVGAISPRAIGVFGERIDVGPV